jgi:pimeloyl-ACP methyl ester carboxylesterase
MSAAVWLVASFALASPAPRPAPRAQTQKPVAGPSAKQLETLAARYLALDARTEAGAEEQRTILTELEAAPELTAPQEKAWRKKLLELAAKAGPEIEEDTGAHYFWPEDKKGKHGKGLYIVGGNTKKPKGLLIGMHGGGAGEGDAWSAHGGLNSAASQLDWLALFPEVLEKTERGWTDSGTEEFVVDLIEAALRTWKIDRNRVYLSGHSMGGYGTWLLGAHHADAVAGLAPSAGAPTPILNSAGVATDIDWGIVPNLRNVRIRIYQSDDDVNVPPEANRMAAKKLAEAKARWGGFDFEYWEVPGRAHDLPPGGMEALCEKIADTRRNARPEKVVWQPMLAWKRHFYWLAWDAPKRAAIVEAEVDRTSNEVRVKCDQDPSGLCVLLDDGMVDLGREVVVKLEGKEVFRGAPKRTLATLVRTAARNDAELMFSVRVPVVP